MNTKPSSRAPRSEPKPGRDDRGKRPPQSPEPDAAGATAASAPRRRERDGGDRWLYGRHAVLAALANPARRWRRLAVLPSEAAEAADLADRALPRHRGSRDAVQVLDRAALGLLLPEGAVHQGWALEIEPLPAPTLDDVLEETTHTAGRAVLVILDQVTDPHNVGAILRSAAAFGARAVIVPEHGSPPVTGTLAKSASGALDIVALVRVTNLARALDRIKEAGFWSCGLDESAGETLAALDLGPRVALVLGAEGGGLRRLVREHCDFLARLPTLPALPSLNVSNAAAVALYELMRDGMPPQGGAS